MACRASDGEKLILKDCRVLMRLGSSVFFSGIYFEQVVWRVTGCAG